MKSTLSFEPSKKAQPEASDTQANTMSDEQARQLIQRIVSLYDKITAMYAVDQFILTAQRS